LDIGDATVILRLVTHLDPPQKWDVPANDLNRNNSLDSGDVIKALRAVAKIESQPNSVRASGSKAVLALGKRSLAKSDLKSLSAVAAASGATAVLSLDKPSANAGELVTLRLGLRDMPRGISGATFTLDYPTNAVRLVGALSLRTGAIVPSDTLAIWNVSPSQNDFAAQDGHVVVAFSGAQPWPLSNGAVSEFTFAVQPGVLTQARWPIRVRDIEVTSNGFENAVVAAAEVSLTGPGLLSVRLEPVFSVENGFEFEIATEPGTTIFIESSQDLVNWEAFLTVTSESGLIRRREPAVRQGQRFYRARTGQSTH
jgi:hypothetical protein